MQDLDKVGSVSKVESSIVQDSKQHVDTRVLKIEIERLHQEKASKEAISAATILKLREQINSIQEIHRAN
jgi:hypothetical protein